ncbi:MULTISPECIES: hypothetical protein [Aerococcus]|uniref:Uncharacterized protein n=1 Tax=Aerococcus sanguinicola TaxID=119206 RepID=A0A5N1GNY2_9LACT|nr:MULTISPECIES: hypothetical protein [Aerococcus]KAA9301938.1 hypothetical protein F6I03_01655 [Aerococcus sanguinicola]MDK6368638.1 hypothetical protein [Aerococcus sp. UMB9870]MDK6679721.1 hypothetical protein [Aerococcus sp. UMB8608]MDK6686007.1 hypothetical protein [Aerococcus sp. UMB8623]MDK6940813.1 hypothetical protein [Aerococcus sp. UMB8487]
MEELTRAEKEVFDLLPTGRRQAKTASTLCQLLKPQLSVREFRELIASMRAKGLLIGASRTAPQGYYLVADEDELHAFIASYESQVKEEMRVLTILKKKTGTWPAS